MQENSFYLFLWFLSIMKEYFGYNGLTKTCLVFFKDLYLFLDRGEGREKERERNINVWLPLVQPPTGDLAHNPGMCPDWELNQ